MSAPSRGRSGPAGSDLLRVDAVAEAKVIAPRDGSPRRVVGEPGFNLQSRLEAKKDKLKRFGGRVSAITAAHPGDGAPGAGGDRDDGLLGGHDLERARRVWAMQSTFLSAGKTVDNK